MEGEEGRIRKWKKYCLAPLIFFCLPQSLAAYSIHKQEYPETDGDGEREKSSVERERNLKGVLFFPFRRPRARESG